jgi:hypothetical protein
MLRAVRLNSNVHGAMITLHVIGFELLAAGKDYAPFFDKLNALGARRVLECQWVLRGDFIAIELVRLLRPFVERGDKLFIVEAAAGWSSLNAMDLDKEGLTQGLCWQEKGSA